MNENFVSLQVHEGDMTRLERSNRRLLIALVVVVITMLLNNVVWIGFENHRQDITYQVGYETQKR
jgi:hypothetical protein